MARRAGGRVRILVADDHVVFREGLRRILNEDGRFEIVAEAGDSVGTLAKARDSDPDVVILDIAMPGRGGLEVLEELKRRDRQRVLVLSSHPEDHLAVQCLRAGAEGYLTKGCKGSEVVAAILRIHQGGKYISQTLAERLAYEIGPRKERPPHESLSPREHQVLVGLGSGKTVSEIANELSLSPHTVSTYRSRILEKMNLRNNSEVIRYALHYNLVD